MSLLANRPWLHDLWEEAQREPEYATTALWESIFAEVFPYYEYNVASQQPPTKDRDDRRRIDLVVRPRNDRGGPRAVLLFMEAKRTGMTADIVDECERQALTACWAYLIDKKMKSVWAMTCVGSSTRLWACVRPKEGDYLVPVFPPGKNLGDIREYVEIAERGNEVLEYLEYMRANPVPPRVNLRRDSHQPIAEPDAFKRLSVQPGFAWHGFGRRRVRDNTRRPVSTEPTVTEQ